MSIRKFLKVSACTIVIIQAPFADLAAYATSNKQKEVKGSEVVTTNDSEWWQQGDEDPVIHMIVDKVMQRVSVFSNGELVSQSNVSTGKTGYETPGGIFSVLTKNRHHYSNLYRGAAMPYMQRLTWSGIALHESKSVPDYPASHGCVRLPRAFAGKLFKYTKKGAQVIITDRDIAPRRVQSPHLFSLDGYMQKRQMLRQSKDPESLDQSIPAQAKEKPLRILITRHSGRQMVMEIQEILNELKYDAGDVDGWMGRQTGKAIAAFQKDYRHEVTGALGPDLLAQLYRATGRGKTENAHIYVRQNYKDLFDMPLKLEDENVPLGTHQFTAVYPQLKSTEVAELQSDQATEKPLISNPPFWLGISIEQTDWQGRPFERKRKKKKDEEVEQVVEVKPVPSTAENALARVSIPQQLRDKIAGMITPGSTLIIADKGFSRETGRGTDFIVLTK